MSESDPFARRPRVLMVSPEFYPCQVIGAHRSSKFCKYLPAFGYDVSVLTLDPRQTGWAVDERLNEQIPASVRRIEAFYPFSDRVKKMAYGLLRRLPGGRRPDGGATAKATSETPANLSEAQSWLALPDKAIFWAPWALAAGLRPARAADVIYATGPQFSTLVIAAWLKRLAGRPLVIDLRDPWTISELRKYPRPIYERINARLERGVFRRADAIICNTEPVQARYRALYPEIPAGRFCVISNGYDEEDFASLPKPERAPGKIRLGYFGKIYAGRDPGPVFRAARRAIDAGRIEKDRLEFVFFGPSGSLVESAAEAAGVAELVTSNPTIPYAEALGQMALCDVLLILNSPETDALHIPGKAFEYLALGKPILALAGSGALGDLMTRYQFGVRVPPEDGDGLLAALTGLYDDLLAGRWEKYVSPDCANLSRRRLTGELARLFDQVCRPAGGPGGRTAGPAEDGLLGTGSKVAAARREEAGAARASEPAEVRTTRG